MSALHQEITEAIVETTSDGEPMGVVVKQPAATPPSGTWPTVGLFFDAPAIRPALHDYAVRLAAEGYKVVIPDLYHRHENMIGFEPAAVAANPDLGPRMHELLYSLTDDGIQADMDAGLEAAGVGVDDPIAVLGFCLGARAVYRAMMRMPDRVVAGATSHPSFLADDEPDSPHLTAAGLTVPFYMGIGDADELQSIAMHQRFFDAVEPLAHVELEVFAGADHGYSWPGYPNYQETAAETSFAKTTALFRDAFSTR